MSMASSTSASTSSTTTSAPPSSGGGGGGGLSGGGGSATTTTTSAKKSNETTLTHLTKRFVKLLNSSSERVVNLNEASSRLSVAKRRIYDITNVLEGIGLLQKTSKNVTRWIDCPRDSPFAAPPSAQQQQHHHIANNSSITAATTTTTTILQSINPASQSVGQDGDDSGSGTSDADFINLLKTYQKLEEETNTLKATIRQLISGDGAYVTYQDIKSFFNDQIVIAVKAPPETRLEVNESLQIWMKSENGEIEVYLCPQYASNNNNSTNNTNSNTNLIGQTNNVSSDGERGGVSTDDPILSSANTVGEEDPFEPLVPYAREDSHYNFMLDEDYTISSLFPEDNLGLY